MIRVADSAMTAPTEADHLQSGSLRSHDPVDTILHDQAICRGNVETLGSKKKEIRGRFPACNHHCTEHMRLEKPPEARDFERVTDAVGMTVRGNADRGVQRSEQLAYTIDGPQSVGEYAHDLLPGFLHEAFG